MKHKFIFVFFFVFLLGFPVLAQTSRQVNKQNLTIVTRYLAESSYQKAKDKCYDWFKKEKGTLDDTIIVSRTNKLNEYTCRYTLDNKNESDTNH